MVDLLRLYYPRHETIKSPSVKYGDESFNLSQCVPFLSLSNWVFHQLKYFKEIKKFIPQISLGKLHAIPLTPKIIFSLFFQDHKKSGVETRLAKYYIPEITSLQIAEANPDLMMHFLFKSTMIEKAIKAINAISTEGEEMIAETANRYFQITNHIEFSSRIYIISSSWEIESKEKKMLHSKRPRKLSNPSPKFSRGSAQ